MKQQAVQQVEARMIKPDPQQPRRTYSETDLEELAKSIAELGLIQPITVRPSGKSFTIVVGERRYRACKMLKMKTIPCLVRELDEDTVLEIQIIENLQRQDVEPVEEAEAIAKLMEKYAPEEIASRIGRNKKFIYGRIKLSQLIDGFKPFVKQGEMSISLAVAVAMLPVEEQQLILEGMGLQFRGHYVQKAVTQQSFDLDKAAFPLDDADMIPKAGPCTLCPFNSANQGNLFGDGKLVCTKASCYTSKKMKMLSRHIQRAKSENKLLVLGIHGWKWQWDDHQELISILEEKGLTVYTMGDIRTLQEPEKPALEAIREDFDDDFTEEELQKELTEALDNYQGELEQYNNGLKEGYATGMVLDVSTYHITELLMKINDKEDNDGKSAPLKKKKMDDCTPKEKIQKIKLREARKKQLEANKQFGDVFKMVRESDYHNSKKTLTNDEMAAFCITLFNRIGWHDQRDFFKDLLDRTEKADKAEMIEQFRKGFKKETFHKLVRFVMARAVHFGEQNHTNDHVNIAVYGAIRPFLKKQMETIEATYTANRDKREKRLKERVAELERQAKTLVGG